MDLSIVIVSWNVATLLAACLDSIRTSLDGVDLEIVVVDNASSDGSTGLLRDVYPAVRLIANTTNVGFAAAVNQGARECRGRYLWLLNPDTEITKDSYARLRGALEADPSAGIAGPRLVDRHGKAAMGAGGRFPGAGAILNTSLFTYRLLPRARWARGMWLSRDESVTRRIDWVSGAAMLVRRDAFDALGGLDQRFFLLCEDMDFCRRALDAGWTTWYVPETTVLHHEGASMEQQDDDSLLARQASLVSYLEARHRPAVAAWLSAPLRVSYLVRMVVAGLRYAASRSDVDRKRLLLVRKHLRTMS
ncbi:MAG TPA: glycosyltransferase family 2 protein [Coriobacteriia bacterium]